MNFGQVSGTLLPPETPITKSRSESFYEQGWSIILARKGNLAQDETAVAREGQWGWGAADGGVCFPRDSQALPPIYNLLKEQRTSSALSRAFSVLIDE